MVLIYAILIPRYLKLTGSFTTTVILGGITYAAMHIIEGWSVFSTPRNIELSLRTGNAWVHAIGYHAIAPHILVDTPLIADVFGIR